MTQSQEGWEYADADTQYHIHGLHSYPARMIPQIAHRLITTKSKAGELVLDPFCGSGGVLAEALILGRNAIGVDVNPLAHLIARVKTTPLDYLKLAVLTEHLLADAREGISLKREGRLNVVPPYFKNIYHWFKRDVAEELAIVRNAIDKIAPKDQVESYHNFFLVCFSMTLRRVSNIAVRDNPYFIRAMVNAELERHQPDVLEAFDSQVRNSVSMMKIFSEGCAKDVSAKVLLADSTELPLDSDSVDLIVTSPPYGEESHTMSYSRFAKLTLLWLGYDPNTINRFTKKSLGGSTLYIDERAYRARTIPLDSKTLINIYKKVSKTDQKRAREMFSYFWDYAKCLIQMHRVLSKNKFCCIVIGDRTVARVPISNEMITIELARKAGFEHKETYYREIPKKVLPRRDYKVDLINRESVIILQKV